MLQILNQKLTPLLYGFAEKTKASTVSSISLLCPYPRLNCICLNIVAFSPTYCTHTQRKRKSDHCPIIQGWQVQVSSRPTPFHHLREPAPSHLLSPFLFLNSCFFMDPYPHGHLAPTQTEKDSPLTCILLQLPPWASPSFHSKGSEDGPALHTSHRAHALWQPGFWFHHLMVFGG